MEQLNLPINDLNGYADLCHNLSARAGWWDDAVISGVIASNQTEKLASKIALIHSEISEMLEGLRKGGPDDHLPHRSMEEVECVDALIRIFDYAGHRGFDLEAAFFEKLAYNADRADHKRENRAKEGGKKI